MLALQKGSFLPLNKTHSQHYLRSSISPYNPHSKLELITSTSRSINFFLILQHASYIRDGKERKGEKGKAKGPPA